jgi:hypothetical protein
MGKYCREGDSIEGEKIVFQCRDCKINPKLIQLTNRHRGKTGSLIKATCIIEKEFRYLPPSKR